MMAAPQGIARLPLELMFRVDRFLDNASKIAVRLTCKSFLTRLPMHKKAEQLSTNDCFRRLASAHLDAELDRRRCALCHQRYPLELFTGSATSALDREFMLDHGFHRGTGGPGMIPTAADICDHERSRFVSALDPRSSYIYADDPVFREQVAWHAKTPCLWVTSLRSLCLHCHRHREPWRQTCYSCACDYCGVRTVRVFVRLAAQDWGGYRPGTTMIEEDNGWGESKPERSVIMRDEADNEKYFVHEWYNGRRTERYPVVPVLIRLSTPLPKVNSSCFPDWPVDAGGYAERDGGQPRLS
jgi:hypothetical protein